MSAGRYPAHGHCTAAVNSASTAGSPVEHLAERLRVLVARQYQGSLFGQILFYLSTH